MQPTQAFGLFLPCRAVQVLGCSSVLIEITVDGPPQQFVFRLSAFTCPHSPSCRHPRSWLSDALGQGPWFVHFLPSWRPIGTIFVGDVDVAEKLKSRHRIYRDFARLSRAVTRTGEGMDA